MSKMTSLLAVLAAVVAGPALSQASQHEAEMDAARTRLFGTADQQGNVYAPPTVISGPDAPYPYGYGPRSYAPRGGVVPAYPYNRQQTVPTRRDRDGDSVRNNRDRYPDDPSRW